MTSKANVCERLAQGFPFPGFIFVCLLRTNGARLFTRAESMIYSKPESIRSNNEAHRLPRQLLPRSRRDRVGMRWRRWGRRRYPHFIREPHSDGFTCPIADSDDHPVRLDCSFANADANTNAVPDSISDANAHTNAHADSDANSYAAARRRRVACLPCHGRSDRLELPEQRNLCRSPR